MSALAVVVESVALWIAENVPPFGVIAGGAAVGSPLNSPYTSTSPFAAMYTLPFVTTGVENLLAGPAESRAALVSLSYSGVVRSVAGHA